MCSYNEKRRVIAIKLRVIVSFIGAYTPRPSITTWIDRPVIGLPSALSSYVDREPSRSISVILELETVACLSVYRYPRSKNEPLETDPFNMHSFSLRINLRIISARYPYLVRDPFPLPSGAVMCGVRMMLPSRVCRRSFI